MKTITHEQLIADLDELKILAQPLIDYINKKYDPHTTIINVKVFSGRIS